LRVTAGHTATSPPAPLWRRLVARFWAPLEPVWAAWAELGERNIGLIASGVAFWGMLAVFPGTAAIIAVWGFFADPLVIEQILDFFARLVPQMAYQVLDRQFVALMRANESTLGWTWAISTGVAIWSSRAGTEALIRGLNAIYRVSNREGIRQTWVSVTLTLALMGVVIVAIVSVFVVPIVLAFLPRDGWAEPIVSGMRWLVFVVVMLWGLGVIYRYGPNRRGGRSKWITPGAVVAIIIWGAASWALSLYFSNFNRFNEIYGTLGAAVALLWWFYVSAYAVLLGAALNHRLELRGDRRRARREAAKGPPPAVPDDMERT
jgi:membrane protein